MSLDQAEQFLTQITQAPRLGVAAPVPSDDLVAMDDHEALPQSRIRAARTWLFSLGYLASDEDRSDYDMALRVAVTEFQKEAGLTVDGWIGAAETWPRLQELVTFEKEIDLAHWTLADRTPRPALRRAVRLRLSVYGIGKRRGRTDDRKLLPDVQDFFEVLDDLGAGPEMAAGNPAERIGRVMFHDRHLARIVAAADSRKVRTMMEDAGFDPAAAPAFGVLLNFAKVELWLAQENVTALDRRHRGRIRMGRPVIPNGVRKEMERYMEWVDEEVSEVSGLRRAFRREIRGDDTHAAISLFLKTVSRHGQVEDPFAEDRMIQLDTFYAKAGEKERVDPAAETVRVLTKERSFRSRLWDGLRRIWSWAKRALERAIATGKRVLRLARDLAAFAFRAASEGLGHILRVIGAFVRHASTAIGRNNSDPKGLVLVNREFGRDVNLVVSSRAPADYVATYTEKLSVSAQIFRRASAVIGRVIAIGLSAAGGSATPALVLRALIIVVRDLRRVLSYLGEIADLQARHDELETQLAGA